MLQLPGVSPQTELNAKSLVTSREDFLSPFSRRDTETTESESNCRICYVRSKDNWNVKRCFYLRRRQQVMAGIEIHCPLSSCHLLSPLLVPFTPCGKQTCPPPPRPVSRIRHMKITWQDFRLHSLRSMVKSCLMLFDVHIEQGTREDNIHVVAGKFLIAREVWGISHSRRHHNSNAKSDFIS